MPNEDNKKLTTIIHSITGRKWCNYCQSSQPNTGGKDVIAPHGRTRRWKCETCVQRAIQRKKDMLNDNN